MTKLTFNIDIETFRTLKRLASKRSITMTEVIRQGIGTEMYLQEVKESGGSVLVENKKGQVRQLVFR